MQLRPLPVSLQDVVPAAHERWLSAERAARRVEVDLHEAWVAFFFRGAPPPPGELQRRAALLRSAALVALGQAQACLAAPGTRPGGNFTAA